MLNAALHQMASERPASERPSSCQIKGGEEEKAMADQAEGQYEGDDRDDRDGDDYTDDNE
jgi:hypothetical protein